MNATRSPSAELPHSGARQRQKHGGDRDPRCVMQKPASMSSDTTGRPSRSSARHQSEPGRCGPQSSGSDHLQAGY